MIESGLQDVTPRSKKVRRGAHSCQECRRRKVRCIYATADNAKCIVCKRRGTQCISQYEALGPGDAVHKTEYATGKASLDDETLAEDLGVDNAGPTPAVLVSDVHWSTKGESDYTHQVADDFALSEPQAHTTVREALLHALPSKTDISVLAERISVISAVCYQSDYKYHGSGSDKIPKPPSSVKSLLDPERHPTLLARQMLLFAAAVQHLAADEVVPGLVEHQHIIMKRLAESAIKLVNADDALLGTLEGLENLIFEIFYHVDCGNIRRAWITARRAVTAAQMLGVHRPGQHRFTLINDDADLEPEIMWSTIVSMERMLSLLLGLPTSTGHAMLSFQTISSDSALGHNLSALVGRLSGEILARNQMESAQQAMDMTAEIDREIILAAEQMPSLFWRPLAFVGLERDSWKALMETRRAFGHMCYYTLVIQLHLPYILSPHDASQRVYSKIACINAGREILVREVELRAFNPISACCRMSDFLALIAGMALMLGHITGHFGSEQDHLLVHQRLGDRATVERALGCIDPMSVLHEDVLAVRCATVLRDLLAIEEDAARQHNLRVGQPQATKHDQANRRDILIMRVPYLGSIQISRDGVSTLPVARVEQTHSLSESVTIGGIGSMMVGRPRSFDAGEDHRSANGVMPLALSTSQLCDTSQHHNMTYNTPIISATPPKQLDLMFPDPAASFDDWVFQGVDTAFLETMLLGSAVPPSDGVGDERWDLSTFP